MREIMFLLSVFDVMLPVFFTMLLVFLVTYVVLRWRALKDEEPDPQLGIKAAINFFQFILLICALLGFSLIFTALFAKIGKSGGKDLWKCGLGMLWGSAVLFAGFEAYYRIFTNQAEFPKVRRSILGLTLVIMGLIAVFSFLLFWMGLFGKWKGLLFNFPFGLWLIFVPATGGGLILFQKLFFPRPAMPAGYPPAGDMPPGGGGGVFDQPATPPQPMPEQQPMAQEAPAPQQPGYPQPSAPAPQQPGYPQPGAPAPQQPGYPQPGYPQPGAPAPQQPGLPGPTSGSYPSAGTPAPQSPSLPGPGGGYPPGGTPGGGGFGQ